MSQILGVSPESENEDPARRILRRLALIQKAKALGQKNLEQVLIRQIKRLYEMLKVKP